MAINVPTTDCAGGGGVSTEDIVSSFLNSHIVGQPSGTATSLNDSAFAAQWTNDLPGGANVAWDAANARPVAVVDGLFRLSWQVVRELSAIAIPKYVRIESRAQLNTANFIEILVDGNDYTLAGNKQFAAGDSKVVELQAGDFVRLQCLSNGATTLYFGLSTGDYTYIQLEYLGPTPAP